MKKEDEVQEINNLVDKLVDLRKKCVKSRSKKLRREFDEMQEVCAKRLDYLVEARTRKYKGFSNYDDLKQDGRLALYLALQSYEPDKGDFFWWANKYIKTKISREANRHSTIKIPLKHTKYITPYKVSQLPVIVDNGPDAFDSINKDESSFLVRNAVSRLPDNQRRVIELHYEMNTGNRRETFSIGKICDRLNISRGSCVKLLNEAKKTLKQELSELGI